jgi:hypothetical protein
MIFNAEGTRSAWLIDTPMFAPSDSEVWPQASRRMTRCLNLEVMPGVVSHIRPRPKSMTRWVDCHIPDLSDLLSSVRTARQTGREPGKVMRAMYVGLYWRRIGGVRSRGQYRLGSNHYSILLTPDPPVDWDEVLPDALPGEQKLRSGQGAAGNVCCRQDRACGSGVRRLPG